MHMVTIFDKDTGKILGFEAIGRDSIDKKVDVMETAMKGNLILMTYFMLKIKLFNLLVK